MSYYSLDLTNQIRLTTMLDDGKTIIHSEWYDWTPTIYAELLARIDSLEEDRPMMNWLSSRTKPLNS